MMSIPRFLFLLSLAVLLMIAVVHLEHRHRELQKWHARQIYQQQLIDDDLLNWSSRVEQSLERSQSPASPIDSSGSE